MLEEGVWRRWAGGGGNGGVGTDGGGDEGGTGVERSRDDQMGLEEEEDGRGDDGGVAP